MAFDNKVLLIILDGVPWRNWRRLMGNLEGWVKAGEARVWRMRSVLPSTSASCYASIHTGVPPQVHGVTSNDMVRRLNQPDIFSQVTAAGGRNAAVAHSYWSTFFHRAPFDVVRDIEYDAAAGPIHHGRFHTMTGYDNRINQMTPSDVDLFATLTSLALRYEVDYGLLHTCTLDSLGHRYGHDCHEMDIGCFKMDAMLAPFIRRWRDSGYEVMVTADHGQSERGHHGGAGEDMQDFAVYWFGGGEGPGEDAALDQLQLAPTLLTRMGVTVPETMAGEPFLR